MRSVHLERDLKDPRSSQGYVLTAIARQAFERILAGLKKNSTQRAWRIAGDYGSGKTDFGLVLARIAHHRKEELPPELQRFIKEQEYFPCVATGDAEPFAYTILRALGHKWDRRRGRPTTEDILLALRDTVTQKKRQRRDGVLLIIDELGKNLEFAARNPESDDVFLLQRLAEEATRSGDRGFMMVVMLHQAIASYAQGLDSTAKREWDKVAGRFEEIVYAQPIEQVLALVAATLNVDVPRLPEAAKKESTAAMSTAAKLALYSSAVPGSIAELGPKIFPIHPTALPAIVRTMRKFGQNERSLFSFISSAEPMGLQQHCAKSVEDGGHYRLYHFFEYARSNLLPTLTMSSSHTHWGVIEAVLAATIPDNVVEEQVLKTIALLSLLDAPDLPASEEMVTAAISADRRKVEEAVRKLKQRGVVYERGAAKGLCLWPHTSVNLDDAFRSAVDATSGQSDGVHLLCQRIRSEPLVPRAYYVETGTLRYAEVQLVPAADVSRAVEPVDLDGRGADLLLRVVVPSDRIQQRKARDYVAEHVKELSHGLIVTIAEPANGAGTALKDLLAWEWVKDNVQSLSGDRYAREELTRQIVQAHRSLRGRLGGLQNLGIPSPHELELFYAGGKPVTLKTGRELLTFLGERCRKLYPDTPRILNELVNRRSPSAAAVAARTKLAEAMAIAPDIANLGMDDTKRPAEMALYLSILKHGGFHVRTLHGWGFRVPAPTEDWCNLLPALNAITARLKEPGVDALVPAPKLFKTLSGRPLGIREGLQPFILAIYLATHHQNVSVYEDGTYLYDVGGDAFLRLMKEPQFFHFQFSELSGVRSDVFSRLLHALELTPRDDDRSDLLDLVRPLAVFIAREVPEYCRRTTSLSATAIAVRAALLDAREPLKLVFTALPEACGMNAIIPGSTVDTDLFSRRLKSALHEIRVAYPTLIARLNRAISAAFRITDERRARTMIADRASQLSVAVTEPALKAFALRLADKVLDDRAWVESVANLLARKSPERWVGMDETEFHHQLEVNAARFRRTEMALIGTTKKLNGHACRIALTRSDGSEVGDLVSWDGLDEGGLANAEKDFQGLLSKHGAHGLAAAMKAIWVKLDSGKLG